jgi:arylsulfatase A-like enzyme
MSVVGLARAAAGLAVVAAIVLACTATAERPRPANLLLVTVDTLRADHLGFAGYPRDTSPHLDALAREGTWFPRCYSQSATTGAAHATLFTSLPPERHGVHANKQKFPAQLPSIISELRRHGYATAGFASSVVVGRKFGLQEVFEHFDDELTATELNRTSRYERPAGDTVVAVERWVAAAPKDRPFFVWMHLIDPHGPYTAPVDPDRYVGDALYGRIGRSFPIAEGDFDHGAIPAYQNLNGRTDADFYVARYDAEIRYADAKLGELFAFLRERGLDRDTVIAITADHGETLAEPGHRLVFSHGNVAYEETVRIPLVIREARGERRLAGVRRDAPVAGLDVAPTLLALLGFDPPVGFEGRNLLRTQPEPDVPVYSWGAYGNEKLEKVVGTQFSVVAGPERYLLNSKDGADELYDHRDDPTEARNVAADRKDAVSRLRGLVTSRLDRAGAPAPGVSLNPEHVESLKALGYVE